MKFPSHLRKLRKFTVYSFTFYMLILVMFAPVTQIYAAANPTFNRSLAGSITLDNGETITEIIINDPSVKLEVRPEEVGSPYSPISSISGSGDAFTIDDNFIYQESHSEDLLLKHTSIQANDYIQANYTVSDLGYNDDYYIYNISSMTALKDFYEIEAYTTRTVNRRIGFDEYRIVAQGFEVEWDYANFTKARLWLQEFPVFNDEVEIFLCPIGTDNYPNATNVLSTAGSYTGSELASATTIDGVQILPTYTFNEVTLSKGTYFIVVNHTYVDQLSYIWWHGNNTTPYTGLAYRSLDNNNGTGVSWGGNVWDFTLEIELLPVNSTFDGALTFSDPKSISLRDNSTSIDNSYFTIQNSFIGFHYLKSNTSVSVNFDTLYYFSTTYSASSVYSITNSTFNSMTCDWNITWSSNQISTTYTLLSRNLSLIIPADWTSTFNWYYNLTSPFSYEKSFGTYITYLNTNTSAGDWWIETSSPNHLYSATFSDSVSETDRYVLGYWTTNGTDAFGYNGSTIYLDAFVRGDSGSVYNDTTGSLNYTLFDPSGLIVPLKTSLDANLSYVDVTYYSLNGLTNITEGYYSSSITFDPSVYGSDLSGFWTAMVYWDNGTEVGFYTQRIIVQTNTSFICEWEIEPGTNSWTTSDIRREQFDDIDIRAFYYNISEPFFVGNGKAIPSAEVTYTPSWKAGGTFIDSHPSYTATVNADPAVGIHTIDILASGAFLINHTASFDVTVFYKLAFDTLNTYYNANYTNNAYFYFALTDVSAGSNLTDVSPGSPDDMTVTVDNGTNNFVLSSPADYSFTYTGVSELWELDISTSTNDLVVGLYNVFITVQYNNYRANYTEEYVSDVFLLEVSAPKTEIQINSADTTIYTYHTALFNFDFFDTNHSLDLTNAVVDVWFNVSDVSAIVTPIGNSYQIEVTSNNPYTIGISVYINVTKSNYESINNYLLGELNVVIIQTEIVTIDVPSDMYTGYNTSVVIQFNDLDNAETIDGAYLESIITNSTNFVNVSIVELGGGQYNITFINYDVAVF
ncbi:MAG: hypothetical protein KAU62_14645, partial [Candidatus Heimdallarchaeota archaeon]|nr:hypothetical protein [Candidatus Heimdallarchaeota archaeon]MCK4612390.1 hypothetical protein [Candidatus Heimdallarchaeota archaeon]